MKFSIKPIESVKTIRLAHYLTISRSDMIKYEEDLGKE